MNACREKIAIVGMAFRFPGGLSSSASFWEALKEGKDLVTEIGDDRWDKSLFLHPNSAEPGKSYVFSAGQLERIDEFDAKFFGISPREAAQIDPQQRLLLELAWEALEDGGQRADILEGSQCAVYIGIASNDYSHRRLDDLATANAYTMTGNTASIASNRISYVFDLHGPSMSVDTACSSSLVAIHEACKSIWAGEAPMAIAGGVNMLLHPYPFVGFSKASMLSPTGRCRPFDAAGDGYVRSEGAGVLFLKRLSEAERDGDPIHAVIVNSGVNSDGRTNGISLPSINGQSNLLDNIYSNAGIDVNQVAYVEAHGTGTPVGDPVEAKSIGSTLGQKRAHKHTLPIGSIKGNLGHMETASGMAGIIKVIHALKYRAIPPSIQLNNLNPNIDFDTLNLKVVDAYQELKDQQGPLYMGVNSFGFGGANAHVLLEEYVSPSHEDEAESGWQAEQNELPPLYITAQNKKALAAVAKALGQQLREHPEQYYDIAWRNLHRRSRLAQGAVLTPESVADAAEQLDNVADTDFSAAVSGEHFYRGKLLASGTPIVFVYSGNGAQWQGMGVELLETAPEFAEYLQGIDAVLQQFVDFSVIGELKKSPEESRMHLTEYAQPMLFALQVAITRWFAARGLQPDYVLGHSVGEISAAWASGALTLEDATRVIVERSAAQGLTRGTGRMAAAGLSCEELLELLDAQQLSELVEIAGVNGPGSLTLAGQLVALNKIEQYCLENQKFYRLLDLDYAFHSRYMDPIQDRIIKNLANIKPRKANNFISTVTGLPLSGRELGAEYWWQNIRKPVQFQAAIDEVMRQGGRIFMDIGPHPIMRSYINECVRASGQKGLVLPTLTRDGNELKSLHNSYFGAWIAGANVDFGYCFPVPGRFVPMASYPWQRSRHWYETTTESYGLVTRRNVHPLLGSRLRPELPLWESQLDTKAVPYLADHVVGGGAIMPGAGFAEMALAAAKDWYGEARFDIYDIEITSPLLFDDEGTRSVRFELHPESGRFSIKSRRRLSEDNWTLHSVGKISREITAFEHSVSSLSALQSGEPLNGETLYRLTEQVGLSYGPTFRPISKLWSDGQQASADFVLAPDIDLNQHVLHPAILDGCFQTLAILLAGDSSNRNSTNGNSNSGNSNSGNSSNSSNSSNSNDADRKNVDPLAYIPVRLGRLQFDGEASEICHVRCRVTRRVGRSAVADFELLDDAGRLIALASNCRFKAVRFARANQLPQIYRDVSVPCQKTPDSGIALESLMSALQPRVADYLAGAARNRHYDEFLPLSDTLIAHLAYQALKALAGNSFAEQELLAAGRLAKGQVYLFRWLVNLLKDDELLQQDQDGNFQLEAEPELTADDIWKILVSDYRDYLPELTLLGRMIKQLTALLGGETSGAQLGILNPTHNTTEQLFQAGNTYAGVRRLAQLTMEQVLSQPERRNMAVLELSCENQSLLGPLLPHLQDCDSYYYAATDNALIANVQSLYRKTPGFVTALFDINDSHSLETLADDQRFDIICAPHILHRADDPSATLRALAGKLKANGLLLIAEQPANRFADLTEGVAPDWWARCSSDYLHSRLLSRAEWRKALAEAGCQSVEELIDGAGEESAFVLLAQPGSEQPSDRVEPPILEEQCWLFVGDDSPLLHQLADDCRQAGAAVTVVIPALAFSETGQDHYHVNTSEQSGWQLLWDAMDNLPDVIVDLCGMPLAQAAPFSSAAHRCGRALTLSQTLMAFGDNAPQLMFVTCGAVAAGDRPVTQPAEAALWGLARVMSNEHPEYRVRLIDIDDPERLSATELLAELGAGDDEAEIILTAKGRYVTRLKPAKVPVASAPSQPVRLGFTEPGPLKNLKWFPSEAQPLADDQVAIQPKAAGLNFRDVMYAMGLLPDEALENGFSGPTLGMEMCGEVVEVGAKVTDFAVGDSVMGFAPSCFSSRIVTQADALSRKPESWSFADAATVPTTFFTAYYALVHLAKVQPGEKVLIHGGAGGVGLAAIQIAKLLEAEIYVTAGTDEKRDFVALAGADRVFDSRSLAFADQIMAMTDGRGVDVVLNSLAGEAINRNLAILRPFGRFLELGKRDFYADTPIGLRPFRNNISYFGIDADQLMVEQPALTQKLFREMMALFEQGELQPIPYRLFAAERIADAFRYMQQSRQIGKVVIDFNELPQAEPMPAEYPALRLDKDATYLVSGGTSGFGLATAKWLVEKGARHIALISRRGILATEGMLDAAENWGERDVQVIDVQLDLAREDAAAKLAKSLKNCPPVKGIVHAATVIEDGLLRNMDDVALRKVLGPKIAGAWNLHKYSMQCELDFFVLYSSATTCFGNPGQANYVAGNRYLEALADWRRSQQLPALCLSWGAIDDVGFLARHSEIKASLVSRLGGSALRSEQVLAMLERALQTGMLDCAVLDINWSQMKRYLPGAAQPRYSHLALLSDGDSGEQGEDIRALLQGLSAEEARVKVVEMLTQEVSKILCLPADEVDPALSVFEQGMDSLMGVELALSIESRFAVHMPAMAFADGPTLYRVADKIMSQLDPEAQHSGADNTEMTIRALADKHGSDITKEDVTELKRVLETRDEVKG